MMLFIPSVSLTKVLILLWGIMSVVRAVTSFKQMCNSLDEEVDYYNTYYLSQFTNKADISHAARISSLFKNSPHTEIILLTGGLNKGELLEAFLKCRKNITVHGFEIQSNLIPNLRESYKHLHDIHLHNMGLSDKVLRYNVSGVGELAGLFDYDKASKSMAKTHHTLARAEKSSEIQAVPLSQFVKHRNISKVTYLSVDVEGFESKVIKGMRLNEIEYRKIFSAFQFELGGTWQDERRPKDSMTLEETIIHLTENGYILYLIGKQIMMKASKEFFSQIIKTDSYVNGNCLAIHPDFAADFVKKIVEPIDCHKGHDDQYEGLTMFAC